MRKRKRYRQTDRRVTAAGATAKNNDEFPKEC